MEESMFWHTSQKDYTSAILSLIKIAQYNGITFEKQFHETNDFLHSKRSKAVQCDLQPLLRLGLKIFDALLSLFFNIKNLYI